MKYTIKLADDFSVENAYHHMTNGTHLVNNSWEIQGLASLFVLQLNDTHDWELNDLLYLISTDARSFGNTQIFFKSTAPTIIKVFTMEYGKVWLILDLTEAGYIIIQNFSIKEFRGILES